MADSDPVAPKQDYREEVPNLRTSAAPAGGRSSATSIVIGIVMLVAGIGLSMAPTGRVFIGLIVVGIITIIRGLVSR